LTDQNQSLTKVAMPMILATSAVHSWLTRKGLRTFCSVNVRSGECIDPHYFAVLIGCGATTVNAYLAQDSIADRVRRGLIEGSLLDAMLRYRDAIDAGLLKIMSKMGISVISSYRGGLNFEAVGLSRAMVAEYFPGMHSRISGIGVSGIQHKMEEAIFCGDACQSADPYPRPPGHQTPGKAGTDRGSREHHLNPQAVRDTWDVAGRVVARGAQDTEHRHEPDRRKVRQWRRWRGSGAFCPRSKW
jgi:glutamate synthase domain-containing protein 2